VEACGVPFSSLISAKPWELLSAHGSPSDNVWRNGSDVEVYNHVVIDYNSSLSNIDNVALPLYFSQPFFAFIKGNLGMHFLNLSTNFYIKLTKGRLCLSML